MIVGRIARGVGDRLPLVLDRTESKDSERLLGFVGAGGGVKSGTLKAVSGCAPERCFDLYGEKWAAIFEVNEEVGDMLTGGSFSRV